ncbi:MAG: 30S ribosomal protein S1 [Gammaproteobacteria bacterium]|nr:30S ribosomal protein S1 [Gammaproteobacteria bacterium]MCF6231230.1 30S ribosomal protein S1 [Gammaproteobacteria bacterium]
MSESFAELFEESQNKVNMESGAILEGIIVHIGPDVVVVNAGLKSEGVIPVEQFYNEKGELDISEGDVVEVALDTIEDGFGETRLSREKARRAQAWTRLEKACEAGEIVTGLISGRVKGGFTVELGDIRAFLPGSLVDVRPVRDPSYLEGKDLEFKVIKLDRKRNNVVVSRRAVVEAESSEEREELLKSLEEGKVVKGIVKNLTDYGAFIDLGGVDGLLHITDMSWKRIKHPSELINVGDEIDVRVLKFDRERNRVSLGMKQLGEDPWQDVARRYPVSSRLFGKVTNLADYGCFIELEEGVEGLVHVSEMDWTNKNIHPSKVVQVGDEVEVVVLDLDEERRRISLGMKQCQSNPWEAFSATHNKGDQLAGKIKSITDFGVFVGLDGGIDGLVHLSDISWHETGEDAIRNFKKGDEIDTMILSIDPDRERISLGIKQLEKDPVSNFVAAHPKGTVVNGVVKEVEAKSVLIELEEGVEGTLRAADISRDHIADAKSVFSVGDKVEAMCMGLDRKNRSISLSIKAKDNEEEAVAMEGFSKRSELSNPTLGDLIKEQMQK